MAHAGIDFGAKRSGKTVICFRLNDEWTIRQSNKNVDSDKFLDAIVHEYDIRTIFIDAPLSLPAVYRTGNDSDYFYRQADRELSAMSPMFLGGLTARAVRHADYWMKQQRFVYEAYPAALVKELSVAWHYKKELPAFLSELREKIALPLPEVENWHQADAILAWITGYRTSRGEHLTYGNPFEGVIYV